MQYRSLWTVLGVAAVLWLGSMAWLSGYRQGYDEGAVTAWQDARQALRPGLASTIPEVVDAGSVQQ